MTELPKEGAGRPLYESAPKIAPAVPAAPYVRAALSSYPLAWLYVKKLLFLNLFEGFWLLIFAVLFLAGVEVLAPRVGLEPTTTRLTAAGSTIELSRNVSVALAQRRLVYAIRRSPQGVN